MPTYQQHPSSFRDPSGFVFEAAGKLYRQINSSYAENYELLMQSGLYKKLTEKGLLVSHEETDFNGSAAEDGYKTIIPQYIPFISYPYEWCFEQLQDAGLLSLEILRTAIDHEMILKDATPYNIQLLFGKPVFIDTLSFEKYDERKPWIAYRQFCECFLYPLLLASYTGLEVHRIFMAYPDGVPANAVAEALPLKSKFRLSNWLHVFLPASVKQTKEQAHTQFNKSKLCRIIDHLQSSVESLKLHTSNKSIWDRYYEEEILNEEYLIRKKNLIMGMVRKSDKNVLDLGCNRGLFSTLIAGTNRNIVAADDNAYSIAKLYKEVRQNNYRILPICVDIMHPAGAGGFGNKERKSFTERMRFDLCLCLALVHHLCVGKNVPFEMIAAFLSTMTDHLIIEFVSKEDEKVQLLLAGRKDIFAKYDQRNFEAAFSQFYLFEETMQIEGSKRIVYRMKTK